MSEKKLLIVDDEECIRYVLEEAFSRAGYTVRSAENAEEALEVLKQNNVHVMFLDLNLPGMNGVELCKQLRKDRPMDIIYALTGYSSLFEQTECREAGFDDFFQKPVELKTLFKAAQDASERIDQWQKR